MTLLPSRLTVLSLVVVVAGCGGDGDDDTTRVVGAATYRDAATAKDGTPQEPAAPPAQSARLAIVVEGSGEIPNLDPQCSLDPAGRFEAHYLGTLNVSDDAAYASSIGAAAAEIVTPSGCTIPDLTVGLITGVRIRGELDATTQNCETYCAAAARAEAEQTCGATPASVTCRTDAEATGTASCRTTCTTETHVIIAETSIGASVLGELDANALRAAALGDLEAELVFDHMEDDAGTVIDF